MLDKTMYIHKLVPTEIAAEPTKFLSLEEVMDILEKKGAKWVLLEGQEASLDPAFPAVTRALHERLGTRNVLLTNALSMPNTEHVDKVSVGFKAFTEELNIDYTGESNKKVLENFKKLYDSGVELSAETVLIPGYIDAKEIGRIAKFIASVDKDIRLQVDAYFQAGDNPWRAATQAEVEEAVAEAHKYLNNAYCLFADSPREYRVESIFPTEEEMAELMAYEPPADAKTGSKGK
jgi:pyruvate-formate lyase-activating enzyme